MTDREKRAYKRMLRQRRMRRNRAFALLATVCLVMIGTFSFHAIHSNASTGEERISYKYYTDITVAYGETLWDIAGEYVDYDHYTSRNAYISEVCSINHLHEGGSISAGQLLIIPYYSEEYVK